MFHITLQLNVYLLRGGLQERVPPVLALDLVRLPTRCSVVPVLEQLLWRPEPQALAAVRSLVELEEELGVALLVDFDVLPAVLAQPVPLLLPHQA